MKRGSRQAGFEYFFGAEDGKRQDYRIHGGIRPSGAERVVHIHGDIERIFSFGGGSALGVQFVNARLGNQESLHSDSLASVKFEKSQLDWVQLDKLFYVEKESNRLVSPDLYIRLSEGRTGYDTQDWRFGEEDTHDWKGFEYSPKESPNELELKDKDGQLVYDVKWEVVDGELVVNQTHLPKRVIKTVRVPLQIDMGKVNEAVSSKPPYPKSETAALIVPWRHLDWIVRAGLGYSEPSKAKNI